MRFSYIARTMTGQEQRGTIDAPSQEEAREDLRKRALLIEEIHESQPTERDPIPAVASVLPGERNPLWITMEEHETSEESGPTIPPHAYVPLTDTLRLFAGWLLAWYGLVFLLGSLQQLKRLPLEIPFIQSLFLSPIILRLSFITWLFLVLTSLHRTWGNGILKGIALSIVGIVAYAFFHVNV